MKQARVKAGESNIAKDTIEKTMEKCDDIKATNSNNGTLQVEMVI